MKFEDLIVLLRIKEENRTGDKKGSGNSKLENADVVEENESKLKRYNSHKKRIKEESIPLDQMVKILTTFLLKSYS